MATVNGERRSPSPIVLSSQKGLAAGGGSCSYPSLVKFAGADLNAAQSLEEQLHATLSAIDERVSALECVIARGNLSPRQRDDMLAELGRELAESKRKYHAGQFLWSSAPSIHAFDANADLESQLDDLERRLRAGLNRPLQKRSSVDEITSMKQHSLLYERPVSSDSAVFSGTVGSSNQVRLSPIYTPPELKVPPSVTSSSKFSLVMS